MADVLFNKLDDDILIVNAPSSIKREGLSPTKNKILFHSFVYL